MEPILNEHEVIKFLVDKGGRCTNFELVSNFRGVLNDPRYQAEARLRFKDIINTVATVGEFQNVKFIELKREYSVNNGVQYPDPQPSSPSSDCSGSSYTSPLTQNFQPYWRYRLSTDKQILPSRSPELEAIVKSSTRPVPFNRSVSESTLSPAGHTSRKRIPKEHHNLNDLNENESESMWSQSRGEGHISQRMTPGEHFNRHDLNVSGSNLPQTPGASHRSSRVAPEEHGVHQRSQMIPGRMMDGRRISDNFYPMSNDYESGLMSQSLPFYNQGRDRSFSERIPSGDHRRYSSNSVGLPETRMVGDFHRSESLDRETRSHRPSFGRGSVVYFEDRIQKGPETHSESSISKNVEYMHGIHGNDSINHSSLPNESSLGYFQSDISPHRVDELAIDERLGLQTSSNLRSVARALFREPCKTSNPSLHTGVVNSNIYQPPRTTKTSKDTMHMDHSPYSPEHRDKRSILSAQDNSVHIDLSTVHSSPTHAISKDVAHTPSNPIQVWSPTDGMNVHYGPEFTGHSEQNSSLNNSGCNDLPNLHSSPNRAGHSDLRNLSSSSTRVVHNRVPNMHSSPNRSRHSDVPNMYNNPNRGDQPNVYSSSNRTGHREAPNMHSSSNRAGHNDLPNVHSSSNRTGSMDHKSFLQNSDHHLSNLNRHGSKEFASSGDSTAYSDINSNNSGSMLSLNSEKELSNLVRGRDSPGSNYSRETERSASTPPPLPPERRKKSQDNPFTDKKHGDIKENIVGEGEWSVASSGGGKVRDRVQHFDDMEKKRNTKRTHSPLTPDKENRIIHTKAMGTDDDVSISVIDPKLKREWFVKAAQCDYHALVGLLKKEPKLAALKDTAMTSLHWAAKQGDANVVKLIAGAYKVNPNIRSGYTPVHLATLYKHEMIVHLLIHTYGADASIRDYSGKRADQYPANYVRVVAGHKASERRPLKQRPTEPQKEPSSSGSFMRIGSLNLRKSRKSTVFASVRGSTRNWGSASELRLGSHSSMRKKLHKTMLPPHEKKNTLEKKNDSDSDSTYGFSCKKLDS